MEKEQTTQAPVEPATPFSPVFDNASVDLQHGFKNLTDAIASKHRQEAGEATGPRRRGGRKAFPRDESGNIIRPAQGETTDKASTGATGVQAVVPPIDLQLIEDSVKALLQTIDATIKQSVKESAFTLTQSKPMAENLESKVALSTIELNSMAKLSALCCQQYQLVGQHAPALFLGVFAVGYGVRVSFVLRALRSIARQLQAQKANRESGAQTD